VNSAFFVVELKGHLHAGSENLVGHLFQRAGCSEATASLSPKAEGAHASRTGWRPRLRACTAEACDCGRKAACKVSEFDDCDAIEAPTRSRPGLILRWGLERLVVGPVSIWALAIVSIMIHS